MTHRNAAHNFTCAAIGFLVCVVLLLGYKALVWVGNWMGLI